MKLKGTIFFIYFYLFEIKCQTTLQMSQLLPMQLVVQLQTVLLALLALHPANVPLVHHVVGFLTPIGIFFHPFGKQYIKTIL